jgi:hypothetical protein
MKNIEKILEDILLKLNILCGKVDTLEAKINNIDGEKSINIPKPNDTKAMIDKTRADILEKIKNTLPKETQK